MDKNIALTITKKECNTLFQAIMEYRDKVADAVTILSLCGCCPAENKKTVEELNALVSKIAMCGE